MARMQGEIPVYGAIYKWSVADGVITVIAPDGRKKHAPASDSAPVVTARILARRLESEQKD